MLMSTLAPGLKDMHPIACHCCHCLQQGKPVVAACGLALLMHLHSCYHLPVMLAAV